MIAFYRPANRRRAALCVAMAMAVWIAIWQAAHMFWTRPLHETRPSQSAAVVFVLSIAMAGFSGFFGLTLAIRKAWPGVVDRGPRWPKDVRYPGPLRESVKSFVTGEMPPFLRSASAEDAAVPDGWPGGSE